MSVASPRFGMSRASSTPARAGSRARERATASGSMSNARTFQPPRAMVAAIPAPMVPRPMTADVPPASVMPRRPRAAREGGGVEPASPASEERRFQDVDAALAIDEVDEPALVDG